MTASLIGYWEHGRDIQEIWFRAQGKKSKQLNIYDEDPTSGILPPKKLKGRIILGMNDPQQRRLAAKRWKLAGADPLVDPSAIVGHNVKLHSGVVIAPNVLLFHDVVLRHHVHVNYGVSMVRTVVKPFTTISPGVTICGDVEIGKACMIGAGATICNCVTIGDNAVIAAGAVVPPFTNIPADTIWAGVPAKQLDKDRSSITVKHRYQRGDDECQ